MDAKLSSYRMHRPNGTVAIRTAANSHRSNVYTQLIVNPYKRQSDSRPYEDALYIRSQAITEKEFSNLRRD